MQERVNFFEFVREWEELEEEEFKASEGITYLPVDLQNDWQGPTVEY